MTVKNALWPFGLVIVLGIFTIIFSAYRVGSIPFMPVLLVCLLTLMAFMTPVKFQENQLTRHNPFGMVLKRWTLDELSVVDENNGGKTIYGQNPGKKQQKALSTTQWYLNSDQVIEMITAVELAKAKAAEAA